MTFYKHKKLILVTIINTIAFITYIKTRHKSCAFLQLKIIIYKHVLNNFLLM